MSLTKVIPLLLLVFVGYYMFTDPNGLADLAMAGSGALWAGLTEFFGAVIDFLDVLLS